jgi:G3E family GTPase
MSQLDQNGAASAANATADMCDSLTSSTKMQLAQQHHHHHRHQQQQQQHQQHKPESNGHSVAVPSKETESIRTFCNLLRSQRDKCIIRLAELMHEYNDLKRQNMMAYKQIHMLE